jgi:hypothetical protein
LGEIRAEHHGQTMTASAMANQPSIQRRRQSNARERLGRDICDKMLDFIEASCGSGEISASHFDDMINQRDKVLVDQRMPSRAHQAELPPLAFAS